jgi:hypothetical protein
MNQRIDPENKHGPRAENMRRAAFAYTPPLPRPADIIIRCNRLGEPHHWRQSSHEPGRGALSIDGAHRLPILDMLGRLAKTRRPMSDQ